MLAGLLEQDRFRDQVVEVMIVGQGGAFGEHVDGPGLEALLGAETDDMRLLPEGHVVLGRVGLGELLRGGVLLVEAPLPCRGLLARPVDLVLAAYALVVPVGLAGRACRRGCPDGAGQPLKLDVEGTVGLEVGFGDRVLGVRVTRDLRDELVELVRSGPR